MEHHEAHVPPVPTLIRHQDQRGYRTLLLKMLVTAVIIMTAGYAFTARFHIGLDSQEVKCIGNYTFFLVDRSNTSLSRGDIYAFSGRGVSPFFEEGIQMVKILVGLPGDHIAITEDAEINVNGETVATGLALTDAMGTTPEAFMGETVLEEGHYWFMGESSVSFDSRYWGIVKEEQLIGRAYPIF